MITLKIGITPLFKEHISQMQSTSFTSVVGDNSFLNVTKLATNYTTTTTTHTYEVIPKFITNRMEHNQMITTINTIQSRKRTLDAIVNKFFDSNSNSCNDHVNEISRIENSIVHNNQRINDKLNKDYESFNTLISFLINLDAANTYININQLNNNSASSLQNISLQTFRNFQQAHLNYIYSFIWKYKHDLLSSMNIIYDKPIEQGNDNNNITNNNQQIQFNTVVYTQNFNYGLFREMIGSNISDDHCAYWLNDKCPSMKKAAERYFQNSYQAGELTLTFVYPSEYYCITSREVKHSFSFVDDPQELYKAVSRDYSYLPFKYKIIMLNGKEIKKDGSVKFIGALHLLNKSSVFIKPIK
jgi:hypothetical protein